MNVTIVVRLIAVVVTMFAAVVEAGETVTYYHVDALGTPVMESNQSGQVIYVREHRPYGEQALGAPKSGPGFTGHVSDPETGLSYMQTRYLDPVSGRFISGDPVLANIETGANYNRYWYANNNPYRFIDPDGRQAKASNSSQENDKNCKNNTCDQRDEEPRDEADEIVREYRQMNAKLLSDSGDRLKEAGIFGAKEAAIMLAGGPFGKLVGSMGRLFRVGADAKKIAGGHAFAKHGKEFHNLGIKTEKQFAKHIDNVIANPTATRNLERGRVAHWDQRTGTVVIRDPNSMDGGTAFIPTRGMDYFEGLR